MCVRARSADNFSEDCFEKLNAQPSPELCQCETRFIRAPRKPAVFIFGGYEVEAFLLISLQGSVWYRGLNAPYEATRLALISRHFVGLSRSRLPTEKITKKYRRIQTLNVRPHYADMYRCRNSVSTRSERPTYSGP